MRKIASLALVAIMALVVGCGEGDPPANKVENPQKGDGPSKDGTGSQSGPTDTIDAS